MQGKKNIIDDILQSAKKSAETMIADAEADKAAAEAELAKTCEKLAEKAHEEARAAAEAVYAGRVKLGELEAGKITLGYKRAAVDAVYEEVKARILKMKDADYLDLMARYISNECADDDEIIAGEKDKRITGAWVKKLAAACKKKITLSGERGDFDAGVVLRNAEYERDLTVDAIVSDLRDRTEQETIKSLGL